jgi:hypothetical protein
MRSSILLILAPCVLVGVLSGLLGAEDLSVAGHGTAIVAKVSKKNLPKATQDAFNAAESAAILDAISHAVYKVERRGNLGADADSILADTARHWAEFLITKDVAGQSVQNGEAIIDLVIKVDAGKLRDYLDNIHDRPATGALDQRRVLVLAYTVEGMDPNRANGAKLHEVIVSRDRYLQHKERGEQILYDRDAAGSLQAAGASANSSSQASHSDVERAQGLSDFLTGFNQGSAMAASRDNARSDNSAQAGAIDARARDQQHLDASSHREMITVASHDYVRVTDYADLTKKGAGTTNEVRTMLEGMFNKAGLQPRYYNMPLMGLEFATEDDLSDAVLTRIAQDPNVDDEDFVAIAVNRLTPLNPAHEYTSVINYRVMRKSNLDELLPSKNVRGDSGLQPSDDYGRSTATEIAVERAASVLPAELKVAIDRATRSAAREAGPSATYSVRVENIASMADSASLKEALRAAGFAVRSSYKSNSRSENITVELNGRLPSEAIRVIEKNTGSFDVASMDDHSAVLSGH